MAPHAAGKTESGSGWKHNGRWLPAAIALVLVLGTLAVYWPVQGHDFVNYDDPGYVTENYHVLEGLTWDGLRWAFTTSQTANWHPLTWLSHMADCQFLGAQPGGQHLVSLLFHTANTLLLFLALRRMTGALWRSAFVAALFAWHPLHVESVAWIAERKDVLSTFFWLLALLAYGEYVRKAKGQGASETPHASRITHLASRPACWYLLTLLCFALGLMSKPMVVTFPFVLLLLDYWPLNRWCAPEWRNGLPLLKEKLPFFLLLIPSCVVTFLCQRGAGAVSPLTALPLSVRLANALIAYPRYLGKMFWPTELAVLYPHPMHWPTTQVFLAGLLLAALTYLAVRVARTHPYILVGWLWFLGTLVPVIGLVQVGAQSIADRYTYIPLIGPFFVLTWSLGTLAWKLPYRTVLLGTGATAVLLACLGSTHVQVGYWVNSETLFGHTLEVTQNNPIAYNNRGYYRAGKGRPADAAADFQAALQLEPHNADAHSNLGSLLAGQGKLAEAVTHYAEALKTRPGHAGAHYNLGQAYERIGRSREAQAEYALALQAKPDYADAHNNLGIALAGEGHFPEAEQHLRAAVRAKPDYAEAHNNLGNVMTAEGKHAAAVAEFSTALRLKPDYANAHLNLGTALSRLGETRRAVEEYDAVLRLKPDDAEALCRKAWILCTQANPSLRSGAEAVRLASRAAALAGDGDATTLDVLAAAYAETGQFEQALAYAQRAEGHAQTNGQPELAQEIRQRLQLYQTGRCYREPAGPGK